MKLQWINEHIIDLRRSEWDKSLSKPEDDEYNFTKKVYYPMVSRRLSVYKPDHWLYWERYEPRNGYRELSQARAEHEAVPVKCGENLYWPEGIKRNPEGYYAFGDLVLMRMPMMKHLEERKDSVDTARAGAKTRLNQFSQQMKAQGAEISQDDIDRMME